MNWRFCLARAPPTTFSTYYSQSEKIAPRTLPHAELAVGTPAHSLAGPRFSTFLPETREGRSDATRESVGNVQLVRRLKQL